MKDKLEQPLVAKSFEIISTAGTSKSLFMQALAEAKAGNIIEAEKLCKEANEILLQAHRIQTDLLQAEAGGSTQEVNLICVHAQDHLMTTMLLKDMIEYIMDLYKRGN